MEQLRERLHRIDGKGYGAYKDIRGDYAFDRFRLVIDHVQGDPFAAPSRIRVQVPHETAGFPPELSDGKVRRVALCDYLARAVVRAIRGTARGQRGMGKSGEIAICPVTQQVLERSNVVVTESHVEARLTVGLPARGRTVLGREAAAMLLDELPQIVEKSLLFGKLDKKALKTHVETVEDQHHLRGWLDGHNCVAFVADGAMLPRKSGVDERPLKGGVPFTSPDSLRVTVDLPNRGQVHGMGIPKGVTLIVGGGFHGKSTLLNALEFGVYNHIPHDGREQVAADPTAVKVRAEDGRAVTRVNISPFIGNLPFGKDTTEFSTENASGSTSQAAGIIEALDCESRLLLIDEDTSATNFMIRDQRMQQLVADAKEPITPLLFRVRELYEKQGVSSVVVMGGSGDYFAVADTVIMMDRYAPADVTQKARELADPEALRTGGTPFSLDPAGRKPTPISARKGRRDTHITARFKDKLAYGVHAIDLSLVAQIADVSQTRAIGWLIHRYAKKYESGSDNLVEGLRQALAGIERDGLDGLTPWITGDLALPRLFELAAAVNRVRGGGQL